jgi:tight adherence protein C
MDDLLPFGLTMIDVISAAVGLAAALSIYAVWHAALSRDPMRSRIKVLEGRREALRAGYVAPRKRRVQVRRVGGVGQMRQVVSRMNLLGSEQTRQTAALLAQAGWRSKDSVVIFLFCKLVLPLALAIVAIVGVYLLDIGHLKDMQRPVAAIGIVLLSAIAPNIFVKNAIQKRQTAIRKAMPDALDLLVICAEAGLTLDAALARVSRELGRSFPELADELSLASIELGFLQERRQALENLSKRVNLPSMRSVVTTLIQTEKYGTPLAQSLRVLGAEFRNERLMKAEEKAAKLPATLTVPLIVFILPTLFIVLIGPAIIRVMDAMANMH